jgi:hypothetical protein
MAAKSCDHRLANGTVLKNAVGRAQEYGHAIDVMNGTEGDAIVKLRNASTGQAVFAMFVAQNASVEMTDIPDGDYRIQFAFGTALDERCRNFLDLVHAQEFPGRKVLRTRRTGNQIETAELSYTLYAVPSGNVHPTAIASADFNAD